MLANRLGQVDDVITRNEEGIVSPFGSYRTPGSHVDHRQKFFLKGRGLQPLKWLQTAITNQFHQRLEFDSRQNPKVGAD